MPWSIDGHGWVSTRYPPPGTPTASPASSTMSAAMPGIGPVVPPGLVDAHPGERRDHHCAGLGLPPRVDDRAATAADVLPVPDPRLGVDGLPDVAEQPQRREVVALGELRPPLHERADGGGRDAEDGDAVALHDVPQTVLARVVGRALVEHTGAPVHEGPVDDVGVAGDPADVGRAPVDVGVGLQVEHVPVRPRTWGGSPRSCA